MGNIKIHPIPLFGVDVKFQKPKMTYLVDFGRNLVAYSYVWFIEGLAKRILIDAGATAEMALARGFSAEEVTHVQSLEEGLTKLRLKLSDIDTVIVTHLHWDHIGLAHQFVNTKFLVQKDELNFARNPHLAAQFYENELLEGLNFEVLDGDTQITNKIKVLLTPGHTPGGQSVAIETEKGIAVLTGFCCIQDNFEPSEEIRKVTPIIVPGIHVNVMQAYDSMLKVKKAADIIIPIHEPKFAHVDKIP
jgi:glyoxylase-like metal-dependent hydrolase (beta-lactamase superfamily II)